MKTITGYALAKRVKKQPVVIYALMHNGHIPTVVVDGKRVIRVEDAEAWMIKRYGYVK